MKIKEEFRVLPRYSQDFKHKVVREIVTGQYTKRESMELYGISWVSVQGWLNKYGESVILEEGIEEITLKKSNPMTKKNKITESDKVQHLRVRIKELEKELKEAKLKAELNEKIIEIAEERFKIPIRKKYVTRQSPKSKNKG